MFKLLNKKKKDNKGFTLVELVIVIAILAILVGLLAPQYTKYVEKSRKSADVDNMEEMIKAVQVYAVDHAVNTSNNATEVTGKITLGNTVTLTDTATGDIAKALGEYVPKYDKISRKSKQWSVDPYADIKIDAEGGVTASYGPTDFAEYVAKSGSTPTTSTTPTGNNKNG